MLWNLKGNEEFEYISGEIAHDETRKIIYDMSRIGETKCSSLNVPDGVRTRVMRKNLKLKSVLYPGCRNTCTIPSTVMCDKRSV
jgi:hypothetical protein